MGERDGSRVWSITGASTGFGLLLADEVWKRGGLAIQAARDVAEAADLSGLMFAAIFTEAIAEGPRGREIL
jgi:NADP-dependent 3-hydroxy acid dehydrogenase YdfG